MDISKHIHVLLPSAGISTVLGAESGRSIGTVGSEQWLVERGP
jgi:hypothetical protein